MSKLARLFVLAVLLVAGWGKDAYAAACTSAASGNWSLQTTWGAAGTGCAGAPGGIPGAADTVTIAAAHTVTVDVNSAAASIAVAAPSVAAQGVNINPGIVLNVGGAITMAAPTVNGRTSTFAVGSGTLNAGNISISGGTATKISQMTVSTGTITTTGNIAFAGTAANARFVSTGASTVNVGGSFASGGTLTTGGTGTINFNGGAAQTIGAYATYNNIAINNTAGSVALFGNATIGGALSVNTGTLNVGAFTLAVTGTTTVNGAIAITSTAGTKTFTGNVIINSGGVLSETVAEPIAYGGDVVINSGGTLTEFGAATMTCAGNFRNDGAYTASTGVHTFSGAAKTFGGINPVAIPSVTVSGTYQNDGTLTVATALAGGGALTNGASGILNIGGTSAITTLTASAAGNIVNYTGAAAQTIKATTYDTLNTSGAGVKTNSGVVTVNAALTGTALTNTGTLNIGGTSAIATLTATAAGNTVNYTGTGQTVKATAYANLNVTGTATNSGTVSVATALGGVGTLTNAATGILNIGGTSLIATLDATAIGNIVNYSGAAQTVKATTYNHLQFSGSGAKTAAAGLTANGDLTFAGSAAFAAGAFTHNFAGNWIVDTTAATPLSTATTSVINFDTPAIPAPTSVSGTTAATLAFADVNINNTSGVTFNENASFSAGTTPTLTVAAGATLTPAAAVIFSGTGILTGGGTAQVTRTAATADFSSQYTIATKTLTNLTVEYIGAAAQTVSALTYGSATGGGLKVNNASGVSLVADTTVAGTLTLESGVVNAGAFTLIGSGDCTSKVLRNGGHVAGLLQLSFPVGAPSCTFHVGDAAGYRPIDVSFASVSVAGRLTGSVSQAAGEHPDIATSTLDSTRDVNRYWTLTNPAVGSLACTTYTATFNFINPVDFDAGAVPANFEIERWDGAAWNITTLSSATATSTAASGLPCGAAGSSNSFALGEKVQPVVLSINRADADPTNATSVSWTVTFNRNVTGLNSGNFALANIGLGGAPAITGVSGGGKTWSVTASTGTGSGTLGLNMTNSTGVSPAITGLPFTGQVYTLDRTAPAVISILRANPNPTSQASVSWTVTFSESVTGVDMTDFVLAPTGGVSGAAIVSAIGGGTSWTVTASTGSGQGTLGLNLVDDDSIVDTPGNPLGGAGAGNGNFTGEHYDIVSAAPIVYASPAACTNETGIGTQAWSTLAGPLANENVDYATASVDGTITNFLQCTGYGFAIPLGATINGIIVNVDRNSSSTNNGGSQDAAMRLVRDVAGVATIQATDRSTATTYTTADVTEAHGGAADLWGASWIAADINAANFGAAFAATKASAAGGAHTVSVDHIQIGISYTVLPDHYELHLPASGISCLPVTVTVKACADSSSPCTNLYTTASGTSVTLAASAGVLGSTTAVFDGTGVASTTLSYPAAIDGATATVALSGEQIAATNPRKCCPDGVGCALANSCSTTFNTAGFIFSDSAGGMTATIPAQVAGQSSGTYYLRAVKTNTTTKACETALAGANTVNFAYECNNPTTCSASNLMSVNGGTATTIARNNNGSVASYSTVNMTFDADGNAPFTFNYSDVGQVTLHAGKAAGGALLTALNGSSNAFVVKPGGFVLSGIMRTSDSFANPAAADATGAIFVKAGEAFSATVTATTLDGVTPTPNYGQEITPESVKLTPVLAAGLGLTNNPLITCRDPTNPATCDTTTSPGIYIPKFGVFGNGAATGVNFAWNEVGIITLAPSVYDGNYLGAGDVAGTASGNVGRFYAAQFALSGGAIANRTGLGGVCAAPAGCDTFTYMGEQMSAVFNLTAKAMDGATTLQNYNYSATAANNFAKLDPTAIGNPLALAAVDTGTPRTVATLDTSTYGVASGSFGNVAPGVASITAPFAVTRGVSPYGPLSALDVGVAPADSDGAALASFDLAVNAGGAPHTHGKVGSTRARYGRMKLFNAHGSELLQLAIPMEAQYWQGQYWAQNNLDDTTAIVQNNIRLSNAAVTISSVGKDSAGKWRIVLNKPLISTSADICLDLDTGATGDMSCQAAVTLSMPYLQTGTAFDRDPASRATFGVFKGSSELIYLREAY